MAVESKFKSSLTAAIAAGKSAAARNNAQRPLARHAGNLLDQYGPHSLPSDAGAPPSQERQKGRIRGPRAGAAQEFAVSL
jgi:hypothetical protein